MITTHKICLCAVLAASFFQPLSALGSSSMAEALGYGPNEKILLIHADDNGMNQGSIDGTQAVLDAGLVRSSSIMIPAPAGKAAIDQKRYQDHGIHLTFNSEWSWWNWGPILPWWKVFTLVDIWSKEKHFLRDETESYIFAWSSHLEKEARAQIQQAKDWGLDPTHIDAHMGTIVSKYLYVRRYLKLACEFQIPPFVPKWSDHLKVDLPEIIHASAKGSAKYATKKGFLLLDRVKFAFKSKSIEKRRAEAEDFVKSLEPGVTQLIIHPAYLDETFSENQRTHRGLDVQQFTESHFKDLIESEGVRLIGWQEVKAAYDWSKVKCR